MGGVFIIVVAAWAFVGDILVPSGEVSVAAIEVGDVSSDPPLEGRGKAGHHFVEAVPVDEPKDRSRYFVTSAEEILCSFLTPVFVDGRPSGGSDFGVGEFQDNFLVGEGRFDVSPVSKGVNEAAFSQAVAFDIKQLDGGELVKVEVVIGMSLYMYPVSRKREVSGVGF